MGAFARLAERDRMPKIWTPAAFLFMVLAGLSTAALSRDPIATSGGPEITNIIGCVAFEHENFEGSSTDMPKGTRIGYVGDGPNDTISSIACTTDCVLTGYEDRGFGGNWHFWRGNIAYVGDDWNDRISSLTVACEAPKPPPPPAAGVLVPEQSTGPSPFGAPVNPDLDKVTPSPKFDWHIYQKDK
jgi:hypothetical protein